MEGLGKRLGTSAIIAVGSAFAVYAATPHFGQAQEFLSRILSIPLVWVSILALWVGVFCLQQCWARLQSDWYIDSGWWTAAWFFTGVALSGCAGFTIYSLARAMVV